MYEIMRKQLYLCGLLKDCYKPHFRNIIKYQWESEIKADNEIIYLFSCPTPENGTTTLCHCQRQR